MLLRTSQIHSINLCRFPWKLEVSLYFCILVNTWKDRRRKWAEQTRRQRQRTDGWVNRWYIIHQQQNASWHVITRKFYRAWTIFIDLVKIWAIKLVLACFIDGVENYRVLSKSHLFSTVAGRSLLSKSKNFQLCSTVNHKRCPMSIRSILL